MSEENNIDRMIAVLLDNNIPSITIQVTPETAKIDYNLSKGISVQALAELAATLMKVSRDALQFMEKDAEAVSVSKEDFQRLVAGFLNTESPEPPER